MSTPAEAGFQATTGNVVGQFLHFFKSGGAYGERWITIKPHGPDSKGTPVLIRETSKGSGTYHVVGGAGGKLTLDADERMRNVLNEPEHPLNENSSPGYATNYKGRTQAESASIADEAKAEKYERMTPEQRERSAWDLCSKKCSNF